MARQEGGSSATDNRNLPDAKWKEVTGKSLKELETSFTAVTECASSIPCIFNVPVSQSTVPFGFRWVGYISHQLNAAMKDAKSSNVIFYGLIGLDFKVVKTIVTLLQRALLNSDQPPRFALVQEIETRFGTLFHVATRFNKSFLYIRPTLLKSEFYSARKALYLLDTIKIYPDANGVHRIDALEAISVISKGMRHVQTVLEASDKITFIKIISMY